MEFALLHEERELELLADFNDYLFDKAESIALSRKSSYEYKKEALNFLKNTVFKREFNLSYACDVLKNYDAIKEGFAIEGAKVLSKSERMFNVKAAYDVLMDENAREAGINVEAAKIINLSDEEYKAHYASLILKAKEPIEEGVALSGAELINTTSSMDSAERAYSELIVPKDGKDATLEKATEAAFNPAKKERKNVKFLKERGYTDALNKYPEGSDINPNEFLKEVRPDFVKGAKSIIESINPKFVETLPEDYFNTFNAGIPKKRKRFNRK